MHTEKQKLSWCFLSDCIEALQDHRLGFDIQSLIYSLVSIRWLCLSNNLRGKRPLSVVKCEAGMRCSTGAKLARRPRESSIKRDGLFPENVRKKTGWERDPCCYRKWKIHSHTHTLSHTALPWWMMLWSKSFCTILMAVSRSEASLCSISQSMSSLATKQFG